ncbi:hypothetical protein B0J18DRAFT_487258 [Chaetomium sp. MPI-SDFR-AT-0129]|nr:hypothetical protein B0J18DRAFT_487258 [Chaetomium sp. MPI-SDFR-AT-0129]
MMVAAGPALSSRSNSDTEWRVSQASGEREIEDPELTGSDIFDTNTNNYIEFGGQVANYIATGASAVTINSNSFASAEFSARRFPYPKTMTTIALLRRVFL